MPELAEVEIVRRSLNKELIGGHIMSVKDFTFNPKFNEGLLALSHQIKEINREGKFIVFKLKHTSYGIKREMIISLGMTGSLILSRVKPTNYQHLHAQWIITDTDTDSNYYLSYYDPRKFGSIRVVLEGKREGLISKLGPDPLNPDFGSDQNLNKQAAILRKRNKPIKAVLLEQEFAAGIGNYLADEILFRCKLNPETIARDLHVDDLIALSFKTEEVVKEAIDNGGNSFSDFVQIDGEQGNYFSKMRVYGREGQDCVDCGTKIKKIEVATRGTHYCPNCQCEDTKWNMLRI